MIVTSKVVPRAEAEVKLSFSAANVAAEAQSTAQIDAGVDYRDDQWNLIWDPSCAANGTASIGAPGPAAVSGKVSAGAELQARRYGTLGPNLGIRAYARTAAETAPPCDCTYDARSDGGVQAYVEAAASLPVGPLNLTLARLELVELDLLHCDGPHLSGKLGSAPQRSAQP